MLLPSTESPFVFEATSKLKGREWTRKGDGIATFSTKGNDLWIEEAGQWSDTNANNALEGALFQKQLAFRKTGKGGLDILKPDPEGELQPLLTVYPTDQDFCWSSHDPHVCLADLYSAEMILQETNELTVTWSATGPEKDYTTISTYPEAALFRTWLNA